MNKVINILKFQALSGFVLSHSINQTILFHDNPYHLKINTPILFTICFPLLTISSPLFILNYYFNFSFIDKMIDSFYTKYTIERFHQCAPKKENLKEDNIYAYPSLIIIKKKK